MAKFTRSGIGSLLNARVFDDADQKFGTVFDSGIAIPDDIAPFISEPAFIYQPDAPIFAQPTPNGAASQRDDVTRSTVLQPAGSDVVANQITPGVQVTPRVAHLADGRFVMVWTSNSIGATPDPDGDPDNSIQARIFNADGSPAGAEFRVNVSILNSDFRPDIAVLSNGGFVIAWSSSGNVNSIQARIYNSAGVPIGPADIQLSDPLISGGSRVAASIAVLSGGGFAVAWYDDNSDAGPIGGTGIKTRVFSDNGTAVSAETLANTVTASSQRWAATAALGTGYIIAWQDDSNAVGQGVDIRAQRYNANGTRNGTEFVITSSPGTQGFPAATTLANGNVVIAWTDTSGIDGSGDGIRARIVDVNGNPVGTEFTLNATTLNHQSQVRLDSIGTGFVATWTDASATGADTSGTAIRSRTFDATGNPISAEQLVNSTTASNQQNPSVSVAADGSYIIAFQDSSATGTDTSSDSVRFRRFALSEPIANDDILAATEDTPITYAAADLTGNDTDPEGNPLSIASVTAISGGTVVLNGDGTVTFTPTANFNGAAQFSYVVTDAAGSTDSATATVNVAAVNDAPTTANLLGNTINYTEQQGQQYLDLGANATIADPDSGNFNGGSLRVQITAGLQAGADFIFFVGNGRVSLSNQSAGATVFVQLAGDASPVAIGTLANDNLFQNNTLINFNSDNATPARVQELLRSITYNGNVDNLTSGQRTVTYTLNDGDGGFGTTTSFVNVTAVNDLPVVGAGTGQASFSEGVNVTSTPVTVAPALSVSDPDNTTLASATATISVNREASDVLAFTNSNATTFGNIAASYDGTTGVLTLTSAGATATIAQFRAALRAVTFTSTSEEPSTAARTISFVVNDGTDNSVASTRQVLVQANNDAPSGTSQTLAINEDQVRTLSESDFGFTDVDGDNFAGVRFGAAPTGGTLFFDADGPGVGNAPVAITTFPTTTYTAADLAAGRITFVPTANLSGNAAAAISFSVVDDGGSVGAGINADLSPNTLTFNITPVADAPVSANASATLFEDGAHVFTLTDFPFSDADGDNFFSVIVSSHPAIGAGGLFFDPGGINGGNRTDLRTFGTGFQVLAADIAAGKFFYIPAANGNGANYASFLFNVRSDNQVSGVFDSAQQTFSFTVTPINDAPAFTGIQGDVLAYVENSGAFAVDVGGNGLVFDPDSANFDGGTLTVSITANKAASEDVFNVFLANGITSAGPGAIGFNNGPAFATFTGAATPGADLVFTFNANATASQITGLVRSVAYFNNNSTSPSTAPRTVTWTLTDGDGGTSVQTSTITVTDVNAAPVLDLNGGDAGFGTTLTVTEQGTALVAPNATLTDADSADLDGGSLTVTYGAGVTASDLVSLRNQSPITTSGTDVLFDGVQIGTITSSGLGQPLVVAFNASATPAAVQALIRAVNTTNSSDAPPAGARALTFTVTDGDGGTISRTANVTINAVDDGPTTNAPAVAQAGTENTDFVFSTANGNAITVSDVDSPTTYAAVFVNNGTLTLSQTTGLTFVGGSNGSSVLVFTGSLANINAALNGLRYRGNLNYNGSDTLTVQVSRDGQVLDDQDPVTINLAPVNDAPSGADATLTLNEDTSRAFTASDFGFSDVDGNSLAAVVITMLPSLGTLQLSGVAVIAGQAIAASDIPNLTYTPAANANGTGYASFTFQVRDNGGTDNSGVDTDQSPNTITFNVSAVNDAPTVSISLPPSAAIEGVPLSLKGGIALDDIDAGAGVVTATLSVGYGMLTVVAGTSGATVVSGNGTGSVVVSGTIAQLNALLNTNPASTVIFTANTDTPPGSTTFTVSVDDGGNTGSGGAMIGSDSEAITINAVNDAPMLDGLAASVTFAENTVNATPQLLDADVTFTDGDGNFAGGTVTLSGLLAEDRAGINNQGIGAGQIGVSGADVTFGGAVIGTFAGGVGTTLTVTLNGSATSIAVDALIENLTYANVSETPTAARTLTLNVTDAAGASIPSVAAFTALTGTNNPFNGIDVGNLSDPDLFDIDGDGDLDLVVGAQPALLVYRNNGAGQAYTQLTGSANPFNGLTFGDDVSPSFVDLDSDGDLDAVIGNFQGQLNAFRNNGAGAAFTAISGAANPYNGINFGINAASAFIDFDGDGDLDTVTSSLGAALRVFRNNGDGVAVTELTGSANPFNGLTVPPNGKIGAFDFDYDGDRDLILAPGDPGALRVYRNNGVGQAFTALTGPTNPFNGISTAGNGTIGFGDFDLDGDDDFVLGTNNGTLSAFLNSPTTTGRPIVVTVTAQNDAPVVDLNGASPGINAALAFSEGQRVPTLGENIVLSDADSSMLTGAIVTITNGFRAGDILRSVGGSGITVSYNAMTGVLTLSGTASVADYQAALSTLSFKTDNNDPGTSRNISIVVNDGSDASVAANVTLSITPTNDAPVNVVPGAQTGSEGGTIIFAAPNGNALLVTDPDGNAGTLRVKLNAEHGTITLATTMGLTVSGDGTGRVTITGALSAINAALEGMTYQGNAGYTGPDSITISTNDGGNGGPGGQLTDTDVIAITWQQPPAQTGIGDGKSAAAVMDAIDVDISGAFVAKEGDTGAKGHLDMAFHKYEAGPEMIASTVFLG